ncbi:hypothetical protein VP01_23g8 [Puccinia sorghi]|uniref:Integrase catalytic domain-containing protein n=1 Tax=Puccinia sorghi TaxID=27349 RepID=A0A0L6V8M1_9BASI|nr:hypothetical protein VP01_23g8 [Puccinia sorghi]
MYKQLKIWLGKDLIKCFLNQEIIKRGDNLSSSHMVSNCQLFTNLDKGESGLINTSCSLSTLQIKGKGSIKTKFKDHIFVLHNVLFVPDINFNVISLRHLLLEQCHINFHINHFTIIKNDKPFLDGHYENNLPILKLRHTLGIPIKASETCKSCAVVKITKASFKHRTSMVENPFEELHLDLIGPISRLLHKLHKYILTIFNGHTRFVAALPLTSKSKVFSTLSQVIDIEAKRLGYYPSVLHLDHGTEFLNAQVGEFCQTNIIRQRFSDEYNPQQNGLAEQSNRTIIESSQTVMLDSGLKPNLWNEVISSCVLALNQIPAHKSKKLSYELFRNSSIPLEFFKPIGNPVAVLSNIKKSKLEPREGETTEYDKAVKEEDVFKTKHVTASSAKKNKCQLFIQGFMKTYGEDVFEPFAPTGKFPSLLVLLVLAIELKLPICQFNVKSVFLFSPLEEDISIKTPEGSKTTTPYLTVRRIHSSFSMLMTLLSLDKWMFLRNTLLGMTLVVHNDSIELSQTGLMKKGLETLGLENCRPVKTPLTLATQLNTAMYADHQAFLKLNLNYRSYTGMLNYLLCRTRPELAAAVSILLKYNQRPGLSHWKEVIHFWKYFRGTSDLGLLLKSKNDKILDQILCGSLAFCKSCPILWTVKSRKTLPCPQQIICTRAKLNSKDKGKHLGFKIVGITTVLHLSIFLFVTHGGNPQPQPT